MDVDLTQLSEHELLALNHRIVERLRFLRQVRVHSQMLEFQVGDRVSFQPPGRSVLFGVLIRYNRKTVSVVTEDGLRWNVSPTLLSRVFDSEPPHAGGNGSHAIDLSGS
jgi:hypothetical protein